MIINIRMKNQEENFFATTDDFTLDSPDGSAVSLDLGGIRIQLSDYAAHDLVYRLGSFLVFLEEGAQAPFSPGEESDNILPFLSPQKRSHV
jgi:hypothetical protein